MPSIAGRLAFIIFNMKGASTMTASPLHRITLNLARSKTAPEGSSLNRYEIIAPLDGEGHLDATTWKDRRKDCTVLRVNGHERKSGLLVHKHGGAGGATWMVDYNASMEADDEAGYRLGSHRDRKSVV